MFATGYTGQPERSEQKGFLQPEESKRPHVRLVPNCALGFWVNEALEFKV